MEGINFDLWLNNWKAKPSDWGLCPRSPFGENFVALLKYESIPPLAF